MPPEGAPAPDDSSADEASRSERNLGDFVRRAVSAGIEAAARGKDDFVRVATGEMRSWLDRLDLDVEIRKALSRMVIEVKSEIRFRPATDGTLVPEATHETKVKVK